MRKSLFSRRFLLLFFLLSLVESHRGKGVSDSTIKDNSSTTCSLLYLTINAAFSSTFRHPRRLFQYASSLTWVGAFCLPPQPSAHACVHVACTRHSERRVDYRNPLNCDVGFTLGTKIASLYRMRCWYNRVGANDCVLFFFLIHFFFIFKQAARSSRYRCFYRLFPNLRLLKLVWPGVKALPLGKLIVRAKELKSVVWCDVIEVVWPACLCKNSGVPVQPKLARQDSIAS